MIKNQEYSTWYSDITYQNGRATYSVEYDLVSVASAERAPFKSVQDDNRMLTRIFNSGNSPSTFLSHIKIGDDPSSTVSHIRKRPAVSSELKGMMVILLKAGGGNVKNNSVDVHVARWSLTYLSP